VRHREEISLLLLSSTTARKLDKKQKKQFARDGARVETQNRLYLLCHLPGSTVHKIIATQAFVTLNRALSRVQFSDY
jgi:hypothetical protein